MKLRLWGYGAIEPDGKPYMEENCVGTDKQTIQEEIVDLENDAREPGSRLRLVALYYKVVKNGK